MAHVVISGGHCFLGSHLREYYPDAFLPKHSEYDLLDQSACSKIVEGADTVIHLAARVGGIGYNQENPATLFYDNALMGIYMIDTSYKAGVKKFVQLGTVCAYPKFTPTPFREKDLWIGYPEETNAPYGLAKKMLLVQLQAYRKQYGFNGIYLLPVNLYGPHDNFNPESSHVIPALIRKIAHAKEYGDELEVWGSGTATREFLYVKDAAEGIYLATKNYNEEEPVNLGSGTSISIKKLVDTLCDIIGYHGQVIWNDQMPDGQPKRELEVSKAKEFGFTAKTSFVQGLTETVKYYYDTIH